MSASESIAPRVQHDARLLASWRVLHPRVRVNKNLFVSIQIMIHCLACLKMNWWRVHDRMAGPNSVSVPLAWMYRRCNGNASIDRLTATMTNDALSTPCACACVRSCRRWPRQYRWVPSPPTASCRGVDRTSWLAELSVRSLAVQSAFCSTSARQLPRRCTSSEPSKYCWWGHLHMHAAPFWI